MIVRYPASAETTMKSSSDPHTRRSNGVPYQSRTAPVTAGRIGKLLTHHVTAKALSTFVRLMTSTGRPGPEGLAQGANDATDDGGAVDMGQVTTATEPDAVEGIAGRMHQRTPA